MVTQTATATKPAKKSRPQWPKIKETRHKNGAKAWMVDARIGGKGERLFFKSKGEAETKAEHLRITRKNQGTAGVAIPEKVRVDAIECVRLLDPLGVSLRDAVDYFIAHARPSGGVKQVKPIVEEFLRAKKDANRRPEYLRVQRYILGKFCESFGERAANEVHADDISTWFRTQTWGQRTRRNYHNDLSNFFGFAVRNGYCAVNPLKRLEKPQVDESGAPGIFTPEEAVALLNASEKLKGKMTPYVALGLFAGLRTTELLKIGWQHVKLDEGIIEITPEISKTRNTRYIKIADNLAAWLRPHQREKGKVRPAACRWHRDKAQKAAGLSKWPDNGLRHSFGSYHFAQHSNAALTASEMGHRGETRTLFSHYRALVKPKAAAQFWEIRPPSRVP